MIFGEPGVDPRIQPLHRFEDDGGLSWASTYHRCLAEVQHQVDSEAIGPTWASDTSGLEADKASKSLKKSKSSQLVA